MNSNLFRCECVFKIIRKTQIEFNKQVLEYCHAIWSVESTHCQWPPFMEKYTFILLSMKDSITFVLYAS